MVADNLIVYLFFIECSNHLHCMMTWGAELAIKAAMKEWSDTTCIQFIEATDKDVDYVEFNTNDKGM